MSFYLPLILAILIIHWRSGWSWPRSIVWGAGWTISVLILAGLLVRLGEWLVSAAAS